MNGPEPKSLRGRLKLCHTRKSGAARAVLHAALAQNVFQRAEAGETALKQIGADKSSKPQELAAHEKRTEVDMSDLMSIAIILGAYALLWLLVDRYGTH